MVYGLEKGESPDPELRKYYFNSEFVIMITKKSTYKSHDDLNQLCVGVKW